MLSKDIWLKYFRAWTIYVIGSMCILLLGNVSLLALDKENTSFKRNIVISQVKYERAGVLISQPSPLDEKIKDIIIFNNIKSLEDYTNWLEKNIKYKKDKNKDNWLSPEELLRNKYGDCEDFAFFNKAVLKVLGYKPEVLVVLRLFNNHALCVFKEKGSYSLIDNTKLRRTPAHSLSELAKYLFRRYNCSSIGLAHFKTKSWDVLFRRES